MAGGRALGAGAWGMGHGGPVQGEGGVPCHLRVTTPGAVAVGTAQTQQRREEPGSSLRRHRISKL